MSHELCWAIACLIGLLGIGGMLCLNRYYEAKLDSKERELSRFFMDELVNEGDGKCEV